MSSMLQIIGVILAAGMSSRMGSKNKLLLDYHGSTIIEQVVRNLSQSKISELLIVTGYDHDRVSATIANQLCNRITVVNNMRYKEGRAESIKCAVNSVSDKIDALLFMVADKPTVPTELIDRAIESFHKESKDILYVMTPSGRGHPIIFSRNLFSELLSLDGDIIGDALIEKYKDNSGELYDSEIQPDIDREEDYLELMSSKSH